MTSPWHMARVASRRQLPKPRKLHGPVGRQIDANRNCMSDDEINHPTDRRVWFAPGECSTCRDCGFHVCSCKPVELMQNGPLHTIIIRQKHPNGCPCTGCVPEQSIVKQWSKHIRDHMIEYAKPLNTAEIDKFMGNR